MSESLEQRLRRHAKDNPDKLVSFYPGDVLELLDARASAPDAELLRNCDCGHGLADHTFSLDLVGCDKCKCKRGILDVISQRIDAALP
jgi:hypothetical protein